MQNSAAQHVGWSTRAHEPFRGFGVLQGELLGGQAVACCGRVTFWGADAVLWRVEG